MNTVPAAGIIPLSKQKGHWKVFLISHRGYEEYWSCPKGHPKPGEMPQDAACRELKEETNLEVQRLISKDPLIEEFTFVKEGQTILKKVLFFVAEVQGTIQLQHEEIVDGRWFTLQEAIEITQHKEGKATLRQVQKILDSVP